MSTTNQTEYVSFADHIADIDGDIDPTDWPEAQLELTVKWYAAEPDVGIFSSTPEIVATDYYWEDVKFTEDTEFAAAVYATIGEHIELTQDGLLELIRKIESELELGEE